jgi:hypothetical protein
MYFSGFCLCNSLAKDKQGSVRLGARRDSEHGCGESVPTGFGGLLSLPLTWYCALLLFLMPTILRKSLKGSLYLDWIPESLQETQMVFVKQSKYH